MSLVPTTTPSGTKKISQEIEPSRAFTAIKKGASVISRIVLVILIPAHLYIPFKLMDTHRYAYITLSVTYIASVLCGGLLFAFFYDELKDKELLIYALNVASVAAAIITNIALAQFTAGFLLPACIWLVIETVNSHKQDRNLCFPHTFGL